MGYELLEHTADVGLRVWAPDLPGLFAEAALGLMGVMGAGNGEPTRREHLELDAPDVEALLVDWLAELLFLFDARGFVFEGARVSLDEGPWRLRADADGSDGERFVQHGPAVKAVTYHGLEVRRTDSGAEARIYLDV